MPIFFNPLEPISHIDIIYSAMGQKCPEENSSLVPLKEESRIALP